MNFRGSFEHTLDMKHRLTVPAKFRAALSGGAVLAASHEATPGSPRCVSIWTPEDYEAYTAKTIEGMRPASGTVRELKRFFFNNSFDAELDSANRLMIPPFLMRYANLDKEVIVTGSGDCVEVWDRDSYDAYRKDVLARISDITASLDDTD